jgi:hypothetical protein
MVAEPGPDVRVRAMASGCTGLADSVGAARLGAEAAGRGCEHLPVGAGSAGPAFDHAGELTVTDGGAFIGRVALLIKHPALV